MAENRQMLRESDRKTTFEKICEVPLLVLSNIMENRKGA